ncbi:MAG: nitroreductase family protein [Bacteroidota bacterium]
MESQIINKKAESDYQIIELLEKRYSPRAFSREPISNSDIHVLLEAGRWAPSCNNFQPWSIIWGIKGSESYDRLYNCLDDFNQKWADNAPLLMITAYNTKRPDGNENFHALHDVGLFAMSMTVQAQNMGIAVHQMAGVKNQEAKKEFKFPESYHVATAIAFGYYPNEIEGLEGDLLNMEKNKNRERKSQNEFTFNGDYIERADLSS